MTNLEAVTGLGIRLLRILIVLRLVEEAELFQSLERQRDTILYNLVITVPMCRSR